MSVCVYLQKKISASLLQSSVSHDPSEIILVLFFCSSSRKKNAENDFYSAIP